jgi:hypothetical protein
MKIPLTAYAAWVTAAFQTIGRDFDAELLLRPGGSMVAIVVWLYAKANAIVLHFGIHLGAKARKPRSGILGTPKERASGKAPRLGALIADRAQELADVSRQKLRFFHGRKMAACGHFRPTHDIEESIGPGSRRR